jgi:hypothetical protein
MLVCNGCHRHVRVEEPSCPFCGAAITMITAPSPARLSTMAFTAGLGLLACGERGESDGMTMTNSVSETATTVGDGDGDLNETLDAAASD